MCTYWAICWAQISARYHCWQPHRTHATGKPTLLISILSKLLLLLNEGVGYSWVYPALNATLLSNLVGPLSRESWFLFPIPYFTWKMRPSCPCLHLTLLFGSLVGPLCMLGNEIPQHRLLFTWQETVQESWPVLRFHSQLVSSTGAGVGAAELMT